MNISSLLLSDEDWLELDNRVAKFQKPILERQAPHRFFRLRKALEEKQFDIEDQ